MSINKEKNPGERTLEKKTVTGFRGRILLKAKFFGKFTK